jgi:hypothetical protein
MSYLIAEEAVFSAKLTVKAQSSVATGAFNLWGLTAIASSAIGAPAAHIGGPIELTHVFESVNGSTYSVLGAALAPWGTASPGSIQAFYSIPTNRFASCGSTGDQHVASLSLRVPSALSTKVKGFAEEDIPRPCLLMAIQLSTVAAKDSHVHVGVRVPLAIRSGPGSTDSSVFQSTAQVATPT